MMSNNPSGGSQFTGKHMLAIMFAFFGVIIAVNLTMATFAHTSWSGLVVQNSYVAGQQFNRKAEEGRRQAMLGWSPALSLEEGVLRFSLADAQGEAIPLAGGTATLRRPVGEADDLTLVLASSGEAVEAPVAIADGAWIVEIHAEVAPDKAAQAGLVKPYRETQRIQLHAGRIR